MTDSDLSILRHAYAKQIMAEASVGDPRLGQAFAKVRREDFVGPGPWQIMRFPSGYYTTPSDDPVYFYQNKLVALDADKGLNNGEPSFLAFLISLGRVQEGEHVVHVGAGVGYYTAMMAQLAGSSGAVHAIEYEPDLAKRAAQNLSPYGQVRVEQGDGSTVALDPSDVILVNAGASRPADTWLDALKDGGRLILPLTVSYVSDESHTLTEGAIFLVERDRQGFAATWKSHTQIYPCFGMRDADSEAALVNAFKAGRVKEVERLHRSDDLPDDQCWVKANGWALTYHCLPRTHSQSRLHTYQSKSYRMCLAPMQ